jgi:hypothetical protein
MLVAAAGVVGIAAVSGADFDQSGPAAALLAGPQLVLAFLLAVSKGRGARMTWSVLALLTGVFDVVVAAAVSESPFSVIAVVAGILALIGAVDGLRTAPRPPKPWA